MTAEEAAMIMMSGSGGSSGQTVCDLLNAKTPILTVELFGGWSLRIWAEQDMNFYYVCAASRQTSRDSGSMIMTFTPGLLYDDELLFIETGINCYYPTSWSVDNDNDEVYLVETTLTKFDKTSITYEQEYLRVYFTYEVQGHGTHYTAGEYDYESTYTDTYTCSKLLHRDTIQWTNTSIRDWQKMREMVLKWQTEYDAYYESIST